MTDFFWRNPRWNLYQSIEIFFLYISLWFPPPISKILVDFWATLVFGGKRGENCTLCFIARAVKLIGKLMMFSFSTQSDYPRNEFSDQSDVPNRSYKRESENLKIFKISKIFTIFAPTFFFSQISSYFFFVFLKEANTYLLSQRTSKNLNFEPGYEWDKLGYTPKNSRKKK